MTLENKPFDEVTLRSYGKIGDVKGRELIKKICLSIGLIQINDSRDVVVDVFFALVLANKEKVWLSSKDIEEQVKKIRSEFKLELKGIAGSNIRRILKQLMDYGFIERKASKYRFIDFSHPSEIFGRIVEKKYDKIISRITNYFNKI